MPKGRETLQKKCYDSEDEAPLFTYNRNVKQ